LRFSEFAQWVEDGNRWRRAKDIGCSVHHVVPQSSDGHGLGDLDQDRLTLNDGQRETIVHTLLDVIPKSSDSGGLVALDRDRLPLNGRRGDGFNLESLGAGS
jgi:hypothetical protein